MIVLHALPPLWGLPSASSSAVAIEAWLRLTRTPLTLVSHPDARHSPTGRLPLLEVGDERHEGRSAVLEYLRATAPLDGHLSPSECATALAWCRLVDHSLRKVLHYSRWMEDSSWHVLKELRFAHLPKPLRGGAAVVARTAVRNQLHGHGVGRLKPEQIYDLGRADLRALATQLGHRRWFIGGRPSSVDAIAYGVLASILLVPLDTPLRAAAESHPELVRWTRDLHRDAAVTTPLPAPPRDDGAPPA